MSDARVVDVAVTVVGAGPAGLAAATRLAARGVGRVVVLDREDLPGGLPAQSEHRGFGLRRYMIPVSGHRYAERLVADATRAGVEIRLQCTALRIGSREVLAVSPQGLERYRCRAVVLASGCREAPWPFRAAAGSRPAGIFNTAVVHRLLTLMRELPGRRVVVVGSEDVGLMAVRLLHLAGARVAAIVEELPYLLGFRANYLYSVAVFGVPLLLGHRVVRILGRRRVAGIDVAPCEPGRGETKHISCDTVVFSGRFVPESTLAFEAGIDIAPETIGPAITQHHQTSAAGVFACGNVLHGAESADVAEHEGARAAVGVASFLAGGLPEQPEVRVICGPAAASVVPHRLVPTSTESVPLLVRSDAPRRNAVIAIRAAGQPIARAWRPWIVPHRGATVRISMPKVGTSGQVEVSVRGKRRGPAFTLRSCGVPGE
jgi:thioredoxin reductase